MQVATVQCIGSETNLRECSLTITSICTQNANAGVTCVGMSHNLKFNALIMSTF